MGRYIHDQNKVAMTHESGTYSNSSGAAFWIGQVTENSIDDAENLIEGRYLGTATRSFSTMDQGPRDVTGTLTYNPQNFLGVFAAIGSVTDGASGTNVLHEATEIQTDEPQSAFTSGTLCPPRSFTLEDSKQTPGTGANFIRTINGVVANSTEITATQGEKITVSTEYIGQTLTFSSGTTTSITEDTTTPYLWSSASLTLDGESIETAKEINLTINNNMEAPHYLNGSRDISTPFPGNRENTLSVTIDLSASDGKKLYRDLYKTNTEFNGVFDLNQDVDATGSQHAIFTLSGCRVTSMENPSANEGVTESTVEIAYESLSAQEWTSSEAGIKYNPW